MIRVDMKKLNLSNEDVNNKGSMKKSYKAKKVNTK